MTTDRHAPILLLDTHPLRYQTPVKMVAPQSCPGEDHLVGVA